MYWGNVEKYRGKPRKRSVEAISIERYRDFYQIGIEKHENMNFQERKDMKKMQTR